MSFVNAYIFAAPEVSSYSNPGGTGNRTGLITVTSNFVPLDGTLSNLVNNGEANNNTDSMKFPLSGQALWVKFDFGAAIFKEVTEFIWEQSTTNNHGTWDFEASNNNTQWDLLLADMTLGGALTNTYTPTLIGGYRYYKLTQSAGLANGIAWMREIKFKIRNLAQTIHNSAIASYDNAGGRGDRVGLVVVSTDLVTSAGALDNLINGYSDNTGTYAWRGNISQASPKFMRFDFGTATILKEWKYSQQLTVSNNTWQLQGSPNASTWTNVGATFTLGGAAEVTYAEAAANTLAFRYWQIISTAGSTSGSLNYWREFRFKLAY